MMTHMLFLSPMLTMEKLRRLYSIKFPSIQLILNYFRKDMRLYIAICQSQKEFHRSILVGIAINRF